MGKIVNKVTTMTLLVFIIGCMVYHVFWLAFATLAIGVFYFLASYLRTVRWGVKNDIAGGFLYLLCAFLLASLLKLFVFEVFTIPSRSMEGTLFAGDKILVDKLTYGLQFPHFPLQICRLETFCSDKSDSGWSDCQGLSGLGEIKRDDIVLFTRVKSEDIHVKRCVGMPSECLMIKNGTVYVNGKVYFSPVSVKQNYHIIYRNKIELMRLLDSLQVSFDYNSLGSIYGTLDITTIQRNLLIQYPIVDSVRLGIDYPQKWSAYPHMKEWAWSFDNLGPLIIPAKGMRIKMNERNFFLYASIIKLYEGISIVKQQGRFWVGEQQIREYVFKNNYLFLLGDNRINSQDSRYWGLIPSQNVIGKAELVLFSNDKKGFKWARLMKWL